MTQLRRATAVEVQVPATSANLGPGFDCFGLALAVHDQLIAVITDDPGVRVDIAGEGAGVLPTDDTHLVIRAMARGFAALDVEMPGILLRCNNIIPQGRGMGSSAAAIVAGLVIARELVDGGHEILPDGVILDVATEMEGHPDNVAAALLGGFTTAWIEAPGDDDLHASVLVREPHAEVRAVLAVPPAPVATAHARGLLADSVPREDAVFNIARAAALTHALCTDPDLLFAATEDRLHQQARSAAYPASHDLVSRLRGLGHPAVISGAGPTVLVLSTRADEIVAVLQSECDDTWRIDAVDLDMSGTRVRTRPLGG
jgi:homoserine kinase